MDKIEHHCQGYSHLSTGKPCQDCAYAESTEALSMAIVCDGHGGERYFRSQYGAEFAVEITKEAIRSFVENIDTDVFAGKPYTGFLAETADNSQLGSKTHQSLMWLFSSIISQWNARIAEHAMANDIEESELAYVSEKYREEFAAMRNDECATFEKTYGCTLMAYVQTPQYWFAFHIGDGKCVMMKAKDETVQISQPIPWDERCFLNKTTSLCDSDALNRFRYCYEGDGNFPLAVFLGSDGMDDTYSDGDILNNFYIQLMKIIIRNGNERAKKELIKNLPEISKLGSKDDMSVAGIYDDTNLSDTFFRLIQYQKDKVDEQRHEIEDRIQHFKKKIEDAGNPEKLDEKQKINLDYDIKDLAKAEAKAIKLDYKRRAIKTEETKYRNRLKEIDPVIPPMESNSSSMELVDIE